MRAVNQAVGRVIRHRHDWGAVILCDERFGQTSNMAQLSRWMRHLVKCHNQFDQAQKRQGCLHSFFSRGPRTTRHLTIGFPIPAFPSLLQFFQAQMLSAPAPAAKASGSVFVARRTEAAEIGGDLDSGFGCSGPVVGSSAHAAAPMPWEGGLVALLQSKPKTGGTAGTGAASVLTQLGLSRGPTPEELEKSKRAELAARAAVAGPGALAPGASAMSKSEFLDSLKKLLVPEDYAMVNPFSRPSAVFRIPRSMLTFWASAQFMESARCYRANVLSIEELLESAEPASFIPILSHPTPEDEAAHARNDACAASGS